MTLRKYSTLFQSLAIGCALAVAASPAAQADGYRRDSDRHDYRSGRQQRDVRGDVHRGDRRDYRDRDRRDYYGWSGRSRFEYRDWRGSRHRWISALPLGYLALTVAGLSYFYYDGLFYQPYSGGYVVVNPPIGAVVYRLPLGYHTYWYGPHVYYYAGGAYYQWLPSQSAYMVVQPPSAPVSASNLVNTDQHIYVYPMHGQNASQTSKDRYECYLWAVKQTGYDPSEASADNTKGFPDYKRALSACLEGRGYSVK